MQCVQARLVDGTVQLRDSKNPNGGTLHISRPAWRDLLATMASGAFDVR
jgi:hypothetical protein